MELPVISNTTPEAEGGGCASSGCGTAPDALGHLPDHIRAKVQGIYSRSSAELRPPMLQLTALV